MNPEALARIEATLNAYDMDEYRRASLTNALAHLSPLADALREARAEIVRQAAPNPEPPTDEVPGGCIYCHSSGVIEDYDGDRPCSACNGTGTPTDDQRVRVIELLQRWVADATAAEQADALMASPVWRNRGRGPITDENRIAVLRELRDQTSYDDEDYWDREAFDHRIAVLEAALDAEAGR